MGNLISLFLKLIGGGLFVGNVVICLMFYQVPHTIDLKNVLYISSWFYSISLIALGYILGYVLENT